MTDMPIKIKTTGAVVLTEELRSFIADKVGKLSKLLDPSDTTALVEVEVQSIANSREGDMYRAEINLSVEGDLLRAVAKRVTLHAAIDEAVAEARRQLRKAKVKHRNLIRRGAAQVKEFFRRFGK
jgi:ribosomal subunit interface protein